MAIFKKASSSQATRKGMWFWFIPAAVLIVAAFVFAFMKMKPSPPSTITIATGSKSGAYTAFAERYKTALKRHGVTLNIVHTQGSVENLKLISDPTQKIDIAFMQGGIAGQMRQSLPCRWYRSAACITSRCGSFNTQPLASQRSLRLAS
jgi:hypothetical protein